MNVGVVRSRNNVIAALLIVVIALVGVVILASVDNSPTQKLIFEHGHCTGYKFFDDLGAHYYVVCEPPHKTVSIDDVLITNEETIE